MDFDKIKQNILNSSETSTSESESIYGSELHEEFEINNFLPEFEPLKLSGKNLAQQYVSAFNTGMNVYQCLNYLQGYVYTLVTAMNETIEAWNTVVPLLEQATKEWTDEEFDYKWSILKPQVIELVTNLTIETFNKAWEELKPVVIKLAQDTTDAEFKKQWDILKPQVITLVEETTTNKFNEEWEKLKPTIIQLSTDTTIAQFNRSWEELKPKVIELSQTTTSNKFDEKWEELRPQIIELAQTTTNTKFDEKWTELQPTLTETVNNLVNTNLETFKSTLWQEVTKNNDFPFLLPENFGAVGDDEVDDSAAFTECFASANANHKYILLSNKTYLIGNTLTNISNTNIIGINATIILGNNTFTKQIKNCVFSNITFERAVKSDLPLVENFFSSQFKYCNFVDINYLFNNISPRINTLEHLLLDECSLLNTQLISATNEFNGRIYSINKTLFYYEDDYKQRTSIIAGYIGGKFIFNNCTFSKFEPDGTIELFGSLDNFEFNNCYINNYDNANTFILPNISSVEKQQITFNNCDISNNNKYLVNVYSTNNTVLPTVNIKYSTLKVNAIFNAKNECSLWLENNQIDTKPIINAGIGKVNLVEIQQKYSDTSENIFPWTSETPTPTVENNVSLIKVGTDQYYVLTESKDKNVKKLDYYFKYDLDYLPTAPYYSNNLFVRDLDLEGYTVKRSYLSDNTCKLKNKSTGELIDYVYFILDDNVTVTTSKDDPQLTYTTIAIKYLPYFAKLKTDTPVAGQLHVDMCISIILEKTSS